MFKRNKSYDLVIVGAGIVGLAHAYEARSRGLSVLVVEKNARCVGASIRNFGFVTISGQGDGDTWRRARHSRDVWNDIAPRAGIQIVHRGSWIFCHRNEAMEVARQFMATPMAAGCRLFTRAEFGDLGQEFPALDSILLEDMQGALYSPLEVRVESREAIGQLAQWLETHESVDFLWHTEALELRVDGLHTSAGRVSAKRVILCPGAERAGIVASAISEYPIKLCTLQMLRLRPLSPITLPGAVMTDNSLARYLGWARLPAAQALKDVLSREVPELLEAGIHLIAVQSSDGSLVIGDSHVYGDSEIAFARDDIDVLILNLARSVIDLGSFVVTERWIGVYPVLPDTDALIHRMSDRHVLVLVTSGTGASTAFGLAKDTFDRWE